MSVNQHSMGPRLFMPQVSHYRITAARIAAVVSANPVVSFFRRVLKLSCVMNVVAVVVLVAACGALAGGLGYWAVRIGRNK